MALFPELVKQGHEQLIFHHDPASGLRAIVAIHSTLLGPALGGTRWYPYPDEGEAVRDAIRLSAAMTQKSAVAGLDLGGGKAVVLGDPTRKTPAQLRAYGEFIESLGGRYLTTTDVGTTTDEIDEVARYTRHVVGTSAARGGSGDTSALTAVTVINGMRAAMRVAFGDESFRDRHIVVVGVGKVGGRVARHAAEHGARVSIADVRADAARKLACETGADVVDVARAYAMESDVLSPNALGDVLTPETIPALRCAVVCGGANNQLHSDPTDADLLRDRGIVYAPDYVVNCGGVINVAVELDGYDPDRAQRLADNVYKTTLAVLETAQQAGISTAAAALRRVEERLAAAKSASKEAPDGFEIR